MKKLSHTLIAALTAFAVGATIVPMANAGGAAPSLGDGSLANGPFSKMHMLLEKTILKVDVVTIDVRVDGKAQGEFVKIAQGKKIEGDVEEQLAKAAIAVDNAVVQMKFERDVSLSQWIDQVEGSLDKAVSAGYVTAARKGQVMSGLPNWFAPIKDRGFKEGDKVLYRVQGGGLRTVLVQADGQTSVDQNDSGADAARVLFAGYFAPGADLRGMLRTLPASN
jgi:hypothetical protein